MSVEKGDGDVCCGAWNCACAASEPAAAGEASAPLFWEPGAPKMAREMPEPTTWPTADPIAVPTMFCRNPPPPTPEEATGGAYAGGAAGAGTWVGAWLAVVGVGAGTVGAVARAVAGAATAGMAGFGTAGDLAAVVLIIDAEGADGAGGAIGPRADIGAAGDGIGGLLLLLLP